MAATWEDKVDKHLQELKEFRAQVRIAAVIVGGLATAAAGLAGWTLSGVSDLKTNTAVISAKLDRAIADIERLRQETTITRAERLSSKGPDSNAKEAQGR